jgi:hypothetical protein
LNNSLYCSIQYIEQFINKGCERWNISKLEIMGTTFRRKKKMIHTSKDAQATAAICSYGQNPWKAQLREATLGLVAKTHPKLCCSLWRQGTMTTP